MYPFGDGPTKDRVGVAQPNNIIINDINTVARGRRRARQEVPRVRLLGLSLPNPIFYPKKKRDLGSICKYNIF